MSKPKISKAEFGRRIENARAKMKEQGLDALLVYGDEYRKEQLRYMANYWPIFDRAGLVVPMTGEPILLAAPESFKVAIEMSPWEDVRECPEFLASYISDPIDYPLANYVKFDAVAEELRGRGKFEKLGVIGVDAMNSQLLKNIEKGFGVPCTDADPIIYELRLVKSADEIACLKEAGRIAECGIKKLLETNLIGLTEFQACGIAEFEARNQGAEAIIFTLCATGKRSNNIVPRPTAKIIEDGDMVSCGMAIMYEGYVATCQVPFAVGNYSKDSWKIIDTLIRANEIGLKELRPGNPMKNIVTAVRDVFRAANLEQYDVYPPMHGCGGAEAENPYPDENTERPFVPGYGVNTDISLFGAPGDANRIEAGYVVTDTGYESLTPFVDEYCAKWLAERESSPHYEG